VEMVLFGIILLVLLLQRARVGREDEERGSWAAVEALRPVPDRLRELWLVRNLGSVVGVVVLVFAALLPFVITNSSASILAGIFALAVVGLSLGIVTGLGGQLSLGQFAVAGVAAVVSYVVSSHGGNFVLAFVYAGLAGAGVSVLLGLPA